jgi:hypothetical protein
MEHAVLDEARVDQGYGQTPECPINSHSIERPPPHVVSGQTRGCMDVSYMNFTLCIGSHTIANICYMLLAFLRRYNVCHRLGAFTPLDLVEG